MAIDKNATILIVEDEDELRTILAEMLEENGYKTLQARDGKEGVELALSKHPDLILLDLLMPVMGGMEALGHIRKDSWGNQAPVVILTNLSATDEHLVEDVIEHKPMSYIIKSAEGMRGISEKVGEILQLYK